MKKEAALKLIRFDMKEIAKLKKRKSNYRMKIHAIDELVKDIEDRIREYEGVIDG